MNKKFEELELKDDFMFGIIMRNPKYCKPFLETILGIKISHKDENYKSLKRSFVIFVCTFDFFGKGC